MISNEELVTEMSEQGIENTMLGLLSHSLKEMLTTEVEGFCKREKSNEPLVLFAEFLGEKPFTSEHAIEVLTALDTRTQFLVSMLISLPSIATIQTLLDDNNLEPRKLLAKKLAAIL